MTRDSWLIFFAGIIFNAGILVTLLRQARKDINGLGRKYWRSIAFQLRALAEDVVESGVKAKLLHLADLIDPR